MNDNNMSAFAAIDRIEAVLAFLADFIGDPDAGSATPRHAAALINTAETELNELRAFLRGEK